MKNIRVIYMAKSRITLVLIVFFLFTQMELDCLAKQIKEYDFTNFFLEQKYHSSCNFCCKIYKLSFGEFTINVFVLGVMFFVDPARAE